MVSTSKTYQTSTTTSGHLPQWIKNIPLPLPAIIAIAVACAILVFALVLCICCKCCCRRKKRSDKVKQGFKEKVSLQSAQSLGVSLKERVQPDVEDGNKEMELESKHVDPSEYVGDLKYSMEYDFQSSELTITVLEGKNFPAMDIGGASDPYVKIYLLPDRKKKLVTKVQYKTLNPIFNESVTIKVPYSELQNRTILFSVYDHDRFSRHDVIGHLRIPIADIDLCENLEQWSALEKADSSKEGKSELGELCFSLRYVPTGGKLTVGIMEAKGLKKMDVGGSSDPYVKISLIIDGKRLKKKKTIVKKRTLDPVWNEAYMFKVPFEKIKDTKIVLAVMDHDRLGKSDLIGKVVVGGSESGAELRHWSDMLSSPRRPIAQWHVLVD